MNRLPIARVPENAREIIASGVQAAASHLRIAQGINKLDNFKAITESEGLLFIEARTAVERLADVLDPDGKFLVKYGQG